MQEELYYLLMQISHFNFPIIIRLDKNHLIFQVRNLKLRKSKKTQVNHRTHKCQSQYLNSDLPASKVKWKWSEVAQSCRTLCDPVDCNLPGSFVHGILQARILEWVAISFSRGSSRPRDWTRVSRLAGRHSNFWATREALLPPKPMLILINRVDFVNKM